MYNYSINAFGSMIDQANCHRVEAYIQAMQSAITPDSVVLEIGTGIGFFAMLAARMGARHVYAIEPNSLIQVGRELAQANGLSDRITFIQKLSTQVTLPEMMPEQADVMISDIRGALPWLADHIPSIMDARTRLLKPGGVMMPQRDSVWAAVVYAPGHYARRVAVWDENIHGLNLAAARHHVVNAWGKGHVKPEQLLTPPVCWATLDYTTVTAPDAKGTIEWVVEEPETELETIPKTGHGLSLWFESELVPGVTMSNNPHDPHIPIYSQLFFPWERPVDLVAGDKISVTLQAKRIENKYEWLWRTRIERAGGDTKADYRQSTFHTKIWSPDILRREDQ